MLKKQALEESKKSEEFELGLSLPPAPPPMAANPRSQTIDHNTGHENRPATLELEFIEPIGQTKSGPVRRAQTCWRTPTKYPVKRPKV
jgi:hypothetical protein